jgi:Polyketide cyclase / dehydrase and lipid transport
VASNQYVFVTHWRVQASIDEVFAILSGAADLPRWWPSVYLEVRVVEPGDEEGVGRSVDLWTKGWLPYTLRWSFRVTSADRPRGFSLEASGDFRGRGVWTLVQDGGVAIATYDWRIRADKPLLKRLSFLLKPAFAANHRWAMARGEESLKLEVLRRHAQTAEELARIPSPPGPTFARAIRLPNSRSPLS